MARILGVMSGILPIGVLWWIATSNSILPDQSYAPLPYSHELDREMDELVGSEAPYAALFSSSDTQVLFIAAEHTNDVTSNTYAWIDTAFAEFHPDLVIFEGDETDRGISRPYIVDRVNKHCLAEWRCGEATYAAYQAFLHDAAYVGGEQSDQVIFTVMEQKGYSLPDLLFYYFTRQIVQYYREGKVRSIDDVRSQFNPFIQSISPVQEVSVEDWEKWLQEHLGGIEFAKLIHPNTPAPVSGGTYVQKIGSSIGIVRDQHILDLIAQSTATYQRILVVYGGSHLPTQYPALKARFGPAVFFVQPGEFQIPNQQMPRGGS